MSADLSARARHARELMDDPLADQRMLERTYLRFALVNRIVSRPGLLYRRGIRPRSAPGRMLRILGVGAGGGDLCRSIAAALRRDEFCGDVTALDPDPRAIDWAQAHDGGAGIRYRIASTSDLVEADERFDVIVSNHLLHHLTEGELQALLEDPRRLAGPSGLVVHCDIARGRGTYALFAAGTLPFSGNLLRGSFIRADGLTSIRRSYTVPELRDAAPSSWQVRAGFPSRLELRWEGGDARS